MSKEEFFVASVMLPRIDPVTNVELLEAGDQIEAWNRVAEKYDNGQAVTLNRLNILQKALINRKRKVHGNWRFILSQG